MTESLKPEKKSKPEIEEFVKVNGGNIFQDGSRPGIICIGDKSIQYRKTPLLNSDRDPGNVPVASMIKRGSSDIIRPKWLFDCIRQHEADRDRSKYLLPLEPR